MAFSGSPTVLGTGLPIASGGTALVAGPASSTDNALVRWDGTGGNLVQNSSLTLSDTDGTITQTTTNGSIILTPNGTGSTLFGPSSLTASARIGALSNATTYGALSFSSGIASTTIQGIYGGGGVDKTLYFGVPTGGNYDFRVNNATAFNVAPSTFNVLVGGITTDIGGNQKIQIPTTGVINLGATARATIGVSADTTAGVLTLTKPSAGSIAINGTGNADAAAAGNVGELLSAQLAVASVTSLVTATGKTVISVSLTAGDWEVSGTVHFIPANTTVVASLIASISATDNTQASVDSVGGFASIGAVYTSAGATMSATPIPVRISLAATTPYYLVATATFSISTCTAYGTIRARRLR